MKDFSRGTFTHWCEKLVEATQAKCTKTMNDIIPCIRLQQETKIQRDMTKQPNPSPIKDANGNITGWTVTNPNVQDEWDRETRKYDRRMEAYDINKHIVCGIVKTSIAPHFIKRLEKQNDFDKNQDNLVWHLKKIKSFCSYDSDEQEFVSVVIEAQLDFLHFRQGNQTLLEFKKMFKQKLSALNDNKMALGAVEALTLKITSGSAAKNNETAIKQFAARVAIQNAGQHYEDLRTDLHDGFACNEDKYPATVKDAFEMLKKYKSTKNSNNNNRSNINHNVNMRNSSNTTESNSHSSSNNTKRKNNQSTRTNNNNNRNSNNNNHQLSFAQVVGNESTENNADNNEVSVTASRSKE